MRNDLFLLENNFKRGIVNTALFIKHMKNDIFIATNDDPLKNEFSSSLKKESKMSMQGGLNFSLGIQTN